MAEVRAREVEMPIYQDERYQYTAQQRAGVWCYVYRSRCLKSKRWNYLQHMQTETTEDAVHHELSLLVMHGCEFVREAADER